jgi:small GTP-binding protein
MEHTPTDKAKAIAKAIGDIIGQELTYLPPIEVPPHDYDDPLALGMPYHREHIKYSVYPESYHPEETRRFGMMKCAQEGEMAVLNLAQCGLDDEKWKQVHDLLQEHDVRLVGLNLSQNQLTEFDGTLYQDLVFLNLNDNKQLYTITLPPTCPELERLWCNNCKIGTLTIPSDPKLTRPSYPKLKYFEAARNEMQSIKFEGDCPELVFLDLGGNALTQFELRFEFKSLAYLYLNKNKLETLEFKHPLLSLETLHLRDNKLNTLPDVLVKCRELVTVYLHGNPLPSMADVISTEEMGNSWKLVYDYLSSGTLVIVNEAKLIIIGNGRVGKTSISIKLRDENAPLKEVAEITPGLDIVPYMVPEHNFKFNIWDFGGQGKYREIQQLFCSRNSLYLFVTSFDDKPEAQDYVGYEYWLLMVNAYSYDQNRGQSCPVIHVVNKIDQATELIDQRLVKEKANIHDFLTISCKPVRNFNMLRASILTALSDKSYGFLTNELPDIWLTAKEAIEARRSEKHITTERFYKDCETLYKIPRDKADSFLEVLSNIGTVIHFGQNEALKNWIILDPSWVKTALFLVIDSNLVRNGILPTEYIDLVWKDGDYDADERENLLKLMLAYHLCYRQMNAQGQIEYVIPELLPNKSPQIPAHLTKPTDQVRFVFDQFVPAGTVNKLMAIFSEGVGSAEINELRRDGSQDKEREMEVALRRDLVWKNNFFIDEQKLNPTHAHVGEDYKNKKITLDLTGSNAKSIFELVSNKLQSLVQGIKATTRIHHLDFKTEVFYTGAWTDMATLIRLGIDPFAVTKVPTAIEKPKTIENSFVKPLKIPIYFSYAWRDSKVENLGLEEISKRMFKALDDEGFNVKIDKKDCKYGDTISGFMEEIGDAKLVIMFISKKYLESIFCMTEFAKIAASCQLKKENFAKRVLLVPIERFDFKNKKIEVLVPFQKYWKDKLAVEAEYRNSGMASPEQDADYHATKDIEYHFGRYAGWLADINQSTTDLLEVNSFDLIKQVIINRLGNAQ